MDIELMRAEYNKLVARMGELSDTEQMTDAIRAEFDRVELEAETLHRSIRDKERREQAVLLRMETGQTSGESDGQFNINTRTGDPFAAANLRVDASTDDLRAQITTGLERDRSTPDDLKVAALRTLANVKGNRREVALRYLATGGAAYRTAFAKLMSGQQHLWSEAERQAVARAQSLTTTAGGFAVPFTLDPTMVLTNDGAINPMRQIARTVQTTSDEWNGVTSAGTTASWDAEAEEVSDDSVTLAQPSIPVHKAQVFIPFSIEVGMDWAGMEGDLRNAMTDAKDRLEATAHHAGSGTGQPTGIVTELTGTASEIASITAEVFAAADVYKLQRLLPARHRMAGPTWLASIGTYGAIRQLDTNGGGDMWTQLGDGTPARLLGWSTAEHSEMDDAGDIDTAATATHRILIVGDWKKYVIVDRVGLTIELIPHLFHTGNNRPSGQRGLYAFWRTGAESVDDNAFRMLKVTTAA